MSAIVVPPRTFRNELRAIKIVWHRDMIRFLRDKPRIVTALLQPIGDGGAVHLLLLRRVDGLGS